MVWPLEFLSCTMPGLIHLLVGGTCMIEVMVFLYKSGFEFMTVSLCILQGAAAYWMAKLQGSWGLGPCTVLLNCWRAPFAAHGVLVGFPQHRSRPA